MLNRRSITITKREIKARLLSKSFLIMTFLVPVFMVMIFSVQYFIHQMAGEGRSDLILISDSDEILNKVQDEIFKTSAFKSGELTTRTEKADIEKFKEKLDSYKPDIIKQKLTGIIFIPSTAVQSKQIEFYSSTPSNASLFYKIKPSINNTLVEIYFSGRQLTKDEINYARKDIDINEFRVSSDNEVLEEGYGNKIALFLFSFLIYFALIFAGTLTMNSVVEEKSNKIVEVLLSSATSTDLMVGKILGTVVVQVIQMAIWLSPVVLLLTTSWFFIPPEYMPKIGFGYLLYFLFNYSIALITYIAVYATLGAIFDNPQDAQSGVWPIVMLIMIPFFIAISLIDNSQNSLTVISSMFPFASLLVMPARMLTGEVPMLQIVISIIVNIIVLLGIFKLSGKIYRIGILLTGKKPKWSEVVKWLRMSN